MNLNTIAKSLQPDVISSFWAMLQELRSQADGNDDRVLKVQVEGWYRQWNAMTGDNKTVTWSDHRQPVIETHNYDQTMKCDIEVSPPKPEQYDIPWLLGWVFKVLFGGATVLGALIGYGLSLVILFLSLSFGVVVFGAIFRVFG